MERKITLTKTLLFAITFFVCCFSYAQDRTCGMLEYMEEQMKDPEFAKEYQRTQEKFKAELKRALAQEDFSQRGGAAMIIPVAVHYPEANEADRACLEALAQNQIDILNADYTATNADVSNWNTAMSSYPGTNLGALNVQFCLAVSNHPIGLDPELLEGNPCITIGYNFGGGSNQDVNWAGYMNFVVRNIGALGFSPKPGSIAAGQAVTMDNNAFASGAGCPGSGVVPQAPYNLGRTVTHELGHFYNLNHPWGPAGPTCAQDDGIADTPNTGQETYGCPADGSLQACIATENILSMNYMDYVNDACMYMFTQDQASLMQTYLNSVQSDFVTGVCTPGAPDFNLTATNTPILTCPTTDTEAVFALTYTTISGFSENTTFSASGLPANATVAFSPTSLNSDGDFTMTVGNLGATAQGEYTITVTGTSSPGGVVRDIDVLLKNTCTEIVCDPYASPANLNLAITDGQAGGGLGTPVANHVINIPNSAPIESMTVTVDISHTYIQDLVIQLVHPDGTTFATLWNRDCVNENDLVVTFDDLGGAIVCAEPTVGTFVPTDLLSTFAGLDMQGDWTLFVADYFQADTGVLNSWSMEICTEQSLSTDDLSFDDFAIFPNPNKGEFTVKLNSNSGNDIAIDVHDIRGRRIFTNSYTNGADFNQAVKLNNVQSGLYLVTVKDGNRKITKKIIVE